MYDIRYLFALYQMKFVLVASWICSSAVLDKKEFSLDFKLPFFRLKSRITQLRIGDKGFYTNLKEDENVCEINGVLQQATETRNAQHC
jgi:hypothetical protein